MNLTLTWDLFIIVFFAIVITYSFIIGKRESVKIIVATYIAIIAVQAIGNVIERLLGGSEGVFRVLGLSFDVTLVATVKIILFITVIIALAIKAGIEVKYFKEPRFIFNTILSALFGFTTAGLLLSTLLTYVADVPLLSGLPQASSLSPIFAQSQLMQVMILNQDLWFSLPALLILAAGFLSNRA
jgi:hypothetical protein